MTTAHVPCNVILTVAAIVAKFAKVSGRLLVNSPLMQPQFRVGAEGSATRTASDPPDSGMQRLVGFEAVTSGGAEVAISAAVRLDPLVTNPHVLLHATRLFAGEVALLALQLDSALGIFLVQISMSL